MIMTEQMPMTAMLALGTGAAIFVLWILIKNGKSAAAKRKKTTLGMIKVAGSDLKLDIQAEAEAEAELEPEAEFCAASSPEPEVVEAAEEADFTEGSDEYGDTISVSVDEVAAAERQEEPADEPIGEPVVDAVQAEEPEYSGNTAASESYDDTDAPFAEAAPSITQTGMRRLPETVRMKERHVLLAEDVAINRELIEAFFEGTGVKFKFAVNGQEACELFEANPKDFSMILMDIQMPVMDGHDAAKRIRAHESDWAKQIPIIAMTGDSRKEDIDQCFDSGMDDHVAKPVDMDALQAKVFDFILNAE